MRLLAFLALAGCGADQTLAFEAQTILPSLQDVLVSARSTADDASFPATQRLNPIENVLDLVPAIEASGQVTVDVPSRRASVPTQAQRVGVELIFNAESASPIVVNTEADGFFYAQLPTSSIDVAVLPTNSATPFDVRRVTFDTTTAQLVVVGGDERVAEGYLDLLLERGTTVYGQTLADGIPVPGVAVQLQTTGGVPGPIVTSNEDGWYSFEATAGLDLEVVTTESSDGVGRVAVGPLTAEPVRADMTLDTTRYTLSAAPMADGLPVVGLPYRIQRLDGDVPFSRFGLTSDAGDLTETVPPGTYELSFLAGADRLFGSAREELVVSADIDVGDVALPALIERVGTLQGQPFARVAVRCQQLNLPGTVWEAESDTSGNIRLLAPDGELDCVFTPPDLRTTAAKRVIGTLPDLSVQLVDGQLVSGRVLLNDDGVGFAVVEATDRDGNRLARVITDENGQYEFRIDVATVDLPTTD